MNSSRRVRRYGFRSPDKRQLKYNTALFGVIDLSFKMLDGQRRLDYSERRIIRSLKDARIR